MRRKSRTRLELLIFLVLLLMGFLFMLLAAWQAVRLPPIWEVQANMDSNIDPDRAYLMQPAVRFEPVEPAILTPPAWDPKALLTLEANATAEATGDFQDGITVVPPMVFNPSSTPTPWGASPVPSTPSTVPTSHVMPIQSPTIAATNTQIPTQEASPTPEATRTPRPTYTPWPTNTLLPSSTLSPTAQPSSTLQPTALPTSEPPTAPPFIEPSPTSTPLPTTASPPTAPPLIEPSSTTIPPTTEPSSTAQPTTVPSPTTVLPTTESSPTAQPTTEPSPTELPATDDPRPTHKPSHTPKPTHTPKPKSL